MATEMETATANTSLKFFAPSAKSAQQISVARIEHHSRCVKCDHKFFVDRQGFATEPRKTSAAQWTPEIRPSMGATSEATWEVPNWAVSAFAAGTLLLVGLGVWMWF